MSLETFWPKTTRLPVVHFADVLHLTWPIRLAMAGCCTGYSDEILASGELDRFKKRVNLVFTSPPFPLNRKKRYGNKVGDEYMEWLSSYGPLLKKMLTPDGSIVVEVGK